MYTYDKLNNITTRSSPNFTNTYYYDETNKTRLTKISENYSMKYFRYDASGNITTYKGSSENADKNLYWTRGNMLKSGNVKSGKSFTYEYDPNNLRYRKIVNGVTTDYYWNGGVLLGEKTGNNVTQYVYDANGIAGMFYNGTYYYFEKNLFGDVLRVYTNGTTVAELKYDSWGNLIGSSGSMTDKVKFRYRGYYYDDETGFYYLQSRYYDPSLGRFISADQLELLASLSQTLGQLNLYAYCGNNPIMYIDQNGEAPTWLRNIAIGLGIVGAALVVCAVTMLTMGVGTTIMATSMMGAVLHGAAIGTLIGAGVGVMAGGVIGGAISGWSTDGIFIGMGIGLGAGAIVGAITGGIVGSVQYTNAANAWLGGKEKMIEHYFKHGVEMRYRNVIEYTKAAKSVISKGRYIASKNAFSLFVSGNKYLFTGVGAGTKLITTFGYRTFTKSMALLLGLI